MVMSGWLKEWEVMVGGWKNGWVEGLEVGWVKMGVGCE